MKFSYEKFLEAKTGRPYLSIQIHPDDVAEFLLELDNHPQFLWVGKEKPSSFSPLETDLWKQSPYNDGRHDIYLQLKPLGGYGREYYRLPSGELIWAMTWGTTFREEIQNHLISVYDLLEDEGNQSLKDIDITSLL